VKSLRQISSQTNQTVTCTNLQIDLVVKELAANS